MLSRIVVRCIISKDACPQMRVAGVVQCCPTNQRMQLTGLLSLAKTSALCAASTSPPHWLLSTDLVQVMMSPPEDCCTSAVPWGYAALGGGMTPCLPSLCFFNVLNEGINPVAEHLKHHLQQALDAHGALQPCPHCLCNAHTFSLVRFHPMTRIMACPHGLFET